METLVVVGGDIGGDASDSVVVVCCGGVCVPVLTVASV